jgi:hypothetical protein
MKISIVIPNFNGGEFLGECLESVVSQEWPDKEIIVMDGGSYDLSQRLIREQQRHLAHWESAPDGGPYHAVEKGLNLATGDILCWVNSDDILLPGALAEVAEIIEEDPQIQWLSGMHATFLEMSELRAKKYPKTDFFLSDETRYAVQLFRNTVHIDWTLDYMLKDVPQGGYSLQQESTFWRRDLWRSVGGFDHRYKLACDYWLWLQFFQRAPLTLADRPFGCFRQTPGQRSVQYEQSYGQEAMDVASQVSASPWAESLRTGTSSVDTCDGPVETDSIVHVRHVVRDKITLATSIAPVDINKQAFCIKTWLQQGCRVLSFNTADEIERIQGERHANLKEVEFVPVQKTAKAETGKDLVLLRDIVAHYQKEDPKTVLGIVNSDILIEQHIDLLSFARRYCAGDACLISSRVDLEDFWNREGQIFMGGFDAFFFRSPHLEGYPMDSEFAIGAPWWDYFLPHFLRQALPVVHYPQPIPFYHKQHTTNYSSSTWIHYGEHFLKHVDPELHEKLGELKGDGYRMEFLARLVGQLTRHFYRNCKTCSPIEWAALPAYGNAFHSRGEEMQKRIEQWAARAILAEERLQR